jgi:phosphocarrier protein
VDAKSIMPVMMLAASQGTQVELIAEGPDEQDAVDALTALINDYFGEGE